MATKDEHGNQDRTTLQLVSDAKTTCEDLHDILTSFGMATIFLDRDLRVHTFTPHAVKLLHLASSDIGRPLGDLASRLEDPALIDDARTALGRQSPSHREITTADGRAYARRILPYPPRPHRALGVTITFMDITDRKQQELEFCEASRQVREMSAYEQIRLSQDLHDAVGQQLAGLSMSAEVIWRTLAQGGSEVAPAVGEIVEGLRETLQQIRLLARGLAEIPVGPGVLAIALEQLCVNNPAILHSGLSSRAEVDRSVDVQDPDVAIHLYRIAQEAVHNAVAHSHGTTLLVALRQDVTHVLMEIKDDGVGLATSARSGMGMRTMRHRAQVIGAALDISSEQGTQITVSVPKGVDHE